MQLGLLLLLHLCLLLIELLDRLRVDVLVVVRRLASHIRLLALRHLGAIAYSARDKRLGTRLLFNPKVLGWFEIVPKDRDDLQDLFITVRVHKEVEV